jgi:hypothetical protein
VNLTIHEQHAALDFLRPDSPQHGETFARLLSQPLFHELVAGQPGYDELIASAEALQTLRRHPYQPVEVSDDYAVQVLLTGGTMEEALSKLAEMQAATVQRDVAERLLYQAAYELEDRAQRFSYDISQLGVLMKDIVDRAAGILHGELRGYETAEDIPDIVARNPAAADAWVELGQLTKRFERAFQLAETMAAPETITGVWPEAWLFVSYADAWPEWFARGGALEGIATVAAAFEQDPPEQPWARMSKPTLLRWIAKLRLEVQALDRFQLQRRHQEMLVEAREAREQLMSEQERQFATAGRSKVPVFVDGVAQ